MAGHRMKAHQCANSNASHLEKMKSNSDIQSKQSFTGRILMLFLRLIRKIFRLLQRLWRCGMKPEQ